jgi:hypothetical protein
VPVFTISGMRTNRKDGSITLPGGNRYYCDALAQHRDQTSLVARFDPQNLHTSIFVQTLDGHLIGEAPCIARVGFNDTEAAREHARIKRQRTKAAKQLAADQVKLDALEAAAMLPPAEPPEAPQPASVGGVFNAGPMPPRESEKEVVKPTALVRLPVSLDQQEGEEFMTPEEEQAAWSKGVDLLKAARKREDWL